MTPQRFRAGERRYDNTTLRIYRDPVYGAIMRSTSVCFRNELHERTVATAWVLQLNGKLAR